MERHYPDEYSCEKSDHQFASAKISTFGEPGYSEGPFVCDAPVAEKIDHSKNETASSSLPTKSSPTICGFRRKVVLISGAIVTVLLIAVIIAAALAATFAKKANHHDDKPAPVAASGSTSTLSDVKTLVETPFTTKLYPSTPTTFSNSQTLKSTSAFSTPTSTLSTTSGPGNVTVECPAANGTTYTSQNQKFIRLCATEHTPELGATVVTQVKTQTMEDCIDACTSYNSNPKDSDEQCVGVNWIYRQAQGEGNSYCWLKGSVKGSENWVGCEAALMVQ